MWHVNLVDYAVSELAVTYSIFCLKLHFGMKRVRQMLIMHMHHF